MIKAVATALVLIVGAAVILWYGNTLNSWVVGGLVGGFSALLLSIPISLVLFSYFSHHFRPSQQDEVLDDEMVLVQQGSYSIAQDQLPWSDDEAYFDEEQEYYEYDEQELYESDMDADDEYILAEQSVWEEEQPRRIPPARSPASRQDPSSQIQRNHYGADPERRSRQREKSEVRPVKDGGSHGRQADPSYGRYRSDALRAARMEAALRAEYDDESGFLSVRATRRLEQMQRSRYISSPPNKSVKSRTSHDLTQSSGRRTHRIVDALPLENRSRRPLSTPDDTE